MGHMICAVVTKDKMEVYLISCDVFGADRFTRSVGTNAHLIRAFPVGVGEDAFKTAVERLIDFMEELMKIKSAEGIGILCSQSNHDPQLRFSGETDVTICHGVEDVGAEVEEERTATHYDEGVSIGPNPEVVVDLIRERFVTSAGVSFLTLRSDQSASPQMVAAKVFGPGPAFQAAFTREKANLGKLRSVEGLIPKLCRTGRTADGGYYILSSPVCRGFHFARQTVAAFHEAKKQLEALVRNVHKAGVAHFDICPRNMVCLKTTVTKDDTNGTGSQGWRYGFIDFGSAEPVWGAQDGGDGTTLEGFKHSMTTPAYSSRFVLDVHEKRTSYVSAGVAVECDLFSARLSLLMTYTRQESPVDPDERVCKLQTMKQQDDLRDDALQECIEQCIAHDQRYQGQRSQSEAGRKRPRGD